MSEVETQPNCTTCGLPLTGSSCRACGGSGVPIPLADGDASSTSAYAAEAPGADLELAQSAWESGDYGRLVSHCFAAIDVSDATMQQGASGPTFKASVRGLAVFVRVDGQTGDVVIETPSVRLPLTQYVPSLRLLLELSDRDATPVRFSVRGDLVMARYVGRLGAMSPTDVCATIKLVVAQALECARLLVGALQSNPFTPAEHAALKIEGMPRGVTLAEELPVSIPQTPKKGSGMWESAASPPPPKVAPMPAPSPAARPTPVREIPAILMPPGGMPNPQASRAKAPTPARMERRTPIAEVRASAIPKPPAPTTDSARVETMRTPTAPPPNKAPAPAARVGLARPAASPPAALAAARTMVSGDAPAPAPDPLGDTFIAQKNAAPPKTGTPTDPFLELLHKAQTLGAVLSFADQPASMCLLIRATVYRAIFEFESVAPGAVAHLFQATLPMTKEIYITAPGVRRGSMAIPAASPAFEVMAKIVAQQGQVDTGETLAIQPITTAQDAKQHLARYVSEIDQAPSDLELRHFLAVGALCELLSRTKLPPATQDRLKGIVAHARKEGPKQAVVELMMTALTRMIA